MSPEPQEAYGLVWPGKKQAAADAKAPPNQVLVPSFEESAEPETTANIVIEGDNLEVLRLLRRAYAGSVRMIYIDPPYNTGRDFIYPDRFPGGAGGQGRGDPAQRHAAWLSMMYPRLVLARTMLREDGILFASIDDHEVHNLRHLLDEIFGAGNFVASVIWQKVFAPKNSAKHFSCDHEYILAYARDASVWRPQPLPRTAEADARYTNRDDDPRGPWASDNLCARNSYGEGLYPVTSPSGRVIAGPPPGTYWRVSKKKFAELETDHRIWWGVDGSNKPRLKRFLSEVKPGRVPQTLWTHGQVGHTQEGKKELNKRLRFTGGRIFDTPKPRRLVEQMLRIATCRDAGDIVMDFFAGSGTTGEAVMALNATDHGDRRFLLVELPAPSKAGNYATIAEMTKARLRDVRRELRLSAAGQDLGFRVFRLVAAVAAGDEARLCQEMLAAGRRLDERLDSWPT